MHPAQNVLLSCSPKAVVIFLSYLNVNVFDDQKCVLKDLNLTLF